jgi:hypothetical protein
MLLLRDWLMHLRGCWLTAICQKIMSELVKKI